MNKEIKHKKHKKIELHKIPRNRYFVITTTILVLFIFFEIFSNINYLISINVDETTKINDVEYSDLLDKAREVGKIDLYSEVEPEYAVLDSEEDTDTSRFVVQQIETLKIKYTVVESMEELSEEVKANLKILMICKKDITVNDCVAIKNILRRGINIIFTVMPSEKSLENEELRDIMGIQSLVGTVKHDGVRFVSGFFLSDTVLDLNDIMVDYTDVELKQGSKTFAYSLLTDRKDSVLENEDLPPLIWRYIYEDGEVYTINADLILLSGGKGLLVSILSKMEDVFVYPIINAYCVVISGLPFLNDVNNDLIEGKFSRTALQFQQDILFPAVSSSYAKHNFVPTYILNTGEVNEGSVQNNNELLSYYHKEIVEQAGELGLYYQDGIQGINSYDYLSDALPKTVYITEEDISIEYSGLLRDCEVVIERWGESLDFSPLDEKVTSLPIVVSGLLPDDKTTLKQALYVTSLGILVVDVSINSILNDTLEEYDWITYSKEYETVLGIHAIELKYLDRLSASDAAKRVKSYQLAIPNIEYNDSNCIISIENFVEEAYFIIRTKKELIGIENGEYSVIADDAYMIKGTDSVVTVFYAEKTGALK